MTPELQEQEGNKMYGPDYIFLALNILQVLLLAGILATLQG